MDILNNHLSVFSTQKTHQANHVGNKKRNETTSVSLRDFKQMGVGGG